MSNNSNGWVNNVGQILESKSGKLYIKFEEDVQINKGDTLTMVRKVDEINKSVESGSISEERGEELKEKLSFIKYTLNKPPRD